MSRPLPEFNPYTSPTPAAGAFAHTPKKAKPTYLMLLCVVSLLLGCLATLRGGCVAASSVIGTNVQRPNRGQQMPPKLEESFRKFEVEGQAIDARYGTFNKIMIGVQALIGLVMAIAAAFVLQGKRPGDLLLRASFLASLLMSAVHTSGFVFQMLEMQPLLDRFSADVGGLAGQDATAANMMKAFMVVAMWGGLVGGAIWFLVKLVLFGHGFFYLGKHQVQAVLE